MRRYKVAPRFYGFLIVCMLVVFGISFCVSFGRLSNELDSLNAAKAERSELTGELNMLRQEISDCNSTDYIERIARDELGMLYPGEISYVDN